MIRAIVVFMLLAASPVFAEQSATAAEIIPGDPTIDPKIATPRQSNGIDYKLRAIDPPICNPAR